MRVETRSGRRIEVTGVGDDGQERAQIRHWWIVDAADAGERAEMRRGEQERVGIRVRVGSGRAAQPTLPAYILEWDGGRSGRQRACH